MKADEQQLMLPEDALREEFLCAAEGPGGQNVNRTATTVRLYFDTLCGGLPRDVTKRLMELAGRRAQGADVVITVRQTRSLAQNRRIARKRLEELIARAMMPPKIRKATRPTEASRKRRLEAKARHSALKRERKKLED